MNYKDFLQAKIDLTRAQIKNGNYIPNEQVATEFTALRINLANNLVHTGTSIESTDLIPKSF